MTVPEGLTIAQAARLFDKPDAFIKAGIATCSSSRVSGIEAPSLEGFLLPNTYYFDKKPTEREVVERMVEPSLKKSLTRCSPSWRSRTAMIRVAGGDGGVARGGRGPSGRRTADVAAVIYNRLERGMPLQMDSTSQYALNKYGQRLLYSDREIDSPYNTYKNRGLPPGPISNPGIASLRAALQPVRCGLYLLRLQRRRPHPYLQLERCRAHPSAVQRFRREIAPQRQGAAELARE